MIIYVVELKERNFMMANRKIPFSPPDITGEEIDAVSEVLRSGWITTGPNSARFEQELANYCGTVHAVTLNSATAGLELILKVLGIGRNDEVITTPYTYAATSNVLVHRGIMPTFVDVKKDSFLIPSNINYLHQKLRLQYAVLR
ncbi:MAG TPA: DegT/DnrJ/EryC1/StrS family aminotransferase [Desulfosporosinus sp.]|nr:DegT/DnrJ/EryC1/StrS family aminotransferase [Desulfosporosinus sp.]